MIGFLIFIALGAFVGWVASIITKRDAQQGWLANIGVGVVGALLGSLVAQAVFGHGTALLALNWGSIFWALLGAVALCMALNYYQRGQVR